MFEEHQQSGTKISFKPPAITLASGCAGILLSFGLCSIQATSHGGGAFFATIGIVVLGISILAILVSVPWFIIAAIINISRR